jgi:hypothetical protein
MVLALMLPGGEILRERASISKAMRAIGGSRALARRRGFSAASNYAGISLKP